MIDKPLIITDPLTTGRRFSRKVRLLSKRDFQSVFQSKACRSSDNKITVLAHNNGLNYARLGLAISKRYARKAVSRNRIKRLIRESFRQHQHLLTGLDIVVLNRAETPRATNSILFYSLKNHWQQIADRCATA